jgi:hypothetical protein
MADIDDLRLGRNIQNYAFDRADEMIISSKIGGESDDRDTRQLKTSLSENLRAQRSMGRCQQARQGVHTDLS